MDVKTTKKNNLLTQIFSNYWNNFKSRSPSYAIGYYDEVVGKMLNCGDPEFSYTEYGCIY